MMKNIVYIYAEDNQSNGMSEDDMLATNKYSKTAHRLLNFIIARISKY